MTFSNPLRENLTHKLKPWITGMFFVGIAVTTVACGATSTRTAAAHPPVKKSTKSSAVLQKGSHLLIEGGKPYAGTANLNHYLAAAKAHPHSVNALYHAAMAEFVNGNLPQSIALYQQAIHQDPANGTLWNNLGNIYAYRLQQPQTALPDYQKALHDNPSNPIIWSNLINCEVSLKNVATAKADAQKALQTLPKDPSNAYYVAIEKDLTSFNHPSSAAQSGS